jgi:hypothetical protein
MYDAMHISRDFAKSRSVGSALTRDLYVCSVNVPHKYEIFARDCAIHKELHEKVRSTIMRSRLKKPWSNKF